MGHYASEMDPNWSASIDATERMLRVRKQVDKMGLGKFKGSDIPMLNRLYVRRALYKSDYVRLRELGVKTG